MTCLALLLTLLSLVTSCLCSKFHRLLLLRTIIRHFKNLNLLRVPLASSLVWNVSLKFSHPPAVINPLSVSIQKSGKKCLILDLRHVNQYLFKTNFRCKDVSIAREVLNPGDFMFSFKLKSGYHHVEIFPEHRQYLRFLESFLLASPGIFNFQSCPLVLVPHLICLLSFSSRQLRNGEPSLKSPVLLED